LTRQPHAAGQTAGGAHFIRTGWQFVERRVIVPALDLLFPPVCVACERVGTLLCERCVADFTPLTVELSRAAPPLSDKVALGVFSGPLQTAIHALKYDRLTALAIPLGDLMAGRIREAAWPVSLLIPIPLHASRQRERGYNQAALLGAVIADRLGWTQEPDLLVRVRQTRTQVGLGYRERQENVAGAFAVATPDRVKGCDVILVDDVYTTGATMRECALVLLQAGARTVRAVVAGQAGAATWVAVPPS